MEAPIVSRKPAGKRGEARRPAGGRPLEELAHWKRGGGLVRGAQHEPTSGQVLEAQARQGLTVNSTLVVQPCYLCVAYPVSTETPASLLPWCGSGSHPDHATAWT